MGRLNHSRLYTSTFQVAYIRVYHMVSQIFFGGTHHSPPLLIASLVPFCMHQYC